MNTIWLQISQDGTNFTTIKSPSTYKIDFDDTDNNSYRSVTNSNLNRNRISKDWIKLQMTWNAVLDTEVYPMRHAVKQNQEYYCRCRCPELNNAGTENFVEFKAYTSKFSSEVIEEASNYRKVSFNIIQSKRESWQ